MSEKKQKYAYWMRPSTVAEIEEMLPEANATSKGNFGRMGAVDYGENYCHQQVYAELSETLGHKSGEVYGHP